MSAPEPISALMLDFGCVITKTMFENSALVERGLGLPEGTLTWRGPFDPDSDPMWRDMMQDRISEREYWAWRAAEIGALVDQKWDTRAFYDKMCDICGSAWFREGFPELLDEARDAGIRVGILSNELALFHNQAWLDAVPALKKVDVIVDATHTKILKPDPRSYRL
jgi:putative hydrolase of the HAD superfamily